MVATRLTCQWGEACDLREEDQQVWQTPTHLATIDLSISSLRMHMDAHSQQVQLKQIAVQEAHKPKEEQYGTDTSLRRRVDKLARPSTSEQETSSEWSFFLSKWDRYKRSAQLAGSEVSDELWNCGSLELRKQAHCAGARATDTEQKILEIFKRIAVRNQNNTAHVIKFLGLQQEENEPFSNFDTRVNGAKALCNFRVKCTNTCKCGEKCESMVDYSDPMKATVLIRGAADREAQERVLTASGEEIPSSAEVRKIVEALETAKRSAEALSQGGGGGLNKLTGQKPKNWRTGSVASVESTTLVAQTQSPGRKTVELFERSAETVRRRVTLQQPAGARRVPTLLKQV